MAGTTRGARPLHDDDGPKRKRGLLPLLLGLLLLAAIIVALLLLLNGGDDDKTSGSGASTTDSAQTTPQEDSATSAGGAGAGTLVAKGQSLLPTPPQDAGQTLAGERAQGKGVEVVDVVEGEGFWVGTSMQERVYVELGGDVGQDEQAAQRYEPKVGDKVDLEGEVRPAPAEPGQTLKIKKAADAKLVKQQGVFVNATDVQQAAS